MTDLKKVLEASRESNWIPQHNCKQHLRIIEETHSVNSLHNIVVGRKSICKICSKVFEQYDPGGLR